VRRVSGWLKRGLPAARGGAAAERLGLARVWLGGASWGLSNHEGMHVGREGQRAALVWAVTANNSLRPTRPRCAQGPGPKPFVARRWLELPTPGGKARIR
jgi:hypothetical protein